MERLAVRLRPFEERDLWCFDREANDREFSAPLLVTADDTAS